MFAAVSHYVKGGITNHGDGMSTGLPLWLTNANFILRRRQKSLDRPGKSG